MARHDVEWDGAKNFPNFERHDIDFEAAKLIFTGPCLEQVDYRCDHGEGRIICIGAVHGLEIVVVYTRRGKTRRLISARRAIDGETKAYRQALLKFESS